MRFLALLCLFVLAARAEVPPDLAAAIANFRSDPPRGWSYTQTTSAEGKSTVERYDAAKPEFDRWSLVQKDGRAPTPDEVREYGEGRSRRSRTGTAPKLTDQFFLEAVETIGDTADRVSYRCPLRPGESRDNTARFLRATVVVHKATRTIESVTLASIGEFSPTFGVKIAELKTEMTYSLPQNETPSLPQRVATHVRGRAFWVKSLDAEMTVVFSAFEAARAK